ncbi:hypothetical protein CK203_094261 [Vitis vinifera]|uniref:Uncharacterized protein n=1 Tax=Vitis vinifera TaxID=29760 RepID=A0A438DD54_VITVI|nr:hypothetical protein CK203_094261 [Vitis vinifera]
MSPPVLLTVMSAGIAVGRLLTWLIMKEEEPRIDPEDRAAEKAAAVGKMKRELVASEARKKAAAEVEEEETDDDEERMKVEMAIENMQKKSPSGFLPNNLQLTLGITLPNLVRVALEKSTKESFLMERRWL